ncbi:hypothetical protein AHAS_Ahas03G0090700 [Arachis hypogaea]
MEGIEDDVGHVPLLEAEEEEEEGRRPLRLRGSYLGIFGSTVFLVSMAALIIYQGHDYYDEAKIENKGNNNNNYNKVPRGVAEGVSAKSNSFLSETTPYNWTNAMLSWQRTAFHFQPERNWMNDTAGIEY